MIGVPMQCPSCRQSVSLHWVTCQNDGCGAHLGYPNVRFAQQQDHVNALDRRHNDTISALTFTGHADEAQSLENTIGSASTAVLVRRSSLVRDMLEKDNGNFLTFYQQIDAGRRHPENPDWDIKRRAVDAVLFPYYEKQVCFLCLSLNDCGMEYYGEWHFSFSGSVIGDRTSVFEENAVIFFNTHKIIATAPNFKGYVAAWADRGKLAVCKLQSDIQNGHTPLNLQAILIREDPQGLGADDYVECHVHGPLNVKDAQRIMYRKATLEMDLLYQDRALLLLQSLGLNPVLIH